MKLPTILLAAVGVVAGAAAVGIQLNLVMKSERCADACAPERGVYEHGRCYCDETQRVR